MKTRLEILIEAPDKTALESAAKQRSVSAAEIVRDLIREHLEELNRNPGAPRVRKILDGESMRLLAVSAAENQGKDYFEALAEQVNGFFEKNDMFDVSGMTSEDLVNRMITKHRKTSK